jgi:anti-anti-sigma regulatory factor
VRIVICDLSTSPTVDMAGAHMLLALQAELSKRNIGFQLVEARSSVRDMLRIEGLEQKVGPTDHRVTLADAIDDFQRTL